MSAAGWHTVALVVELAVYLALTLTGHDGNVVLGVMGGQGVGVAAQAAAK